MAARKLQRRVRPLQAVETLESGVWLQIEKLTMADLEPACLVEVTQRSSQQHEERTFGPHVLAR